MKLRLETAAMDALTVRLFDAIETVDRPKLAAALAAETKSFYRRFFDHELADAAITEILSGTL